MYSRIIVVAQREGYAKVLVIDRTKDDMIVNLVTHSSNAKMYGNPWMLHFLRLRRCTICGFSNVRMYLLAQARTVHMHSK